MQNIIATLLEAKLKSFSTEFTDTSRTVFYDDERKRLIHSGEFGMLREACARELLKNFLPSIYGVSHGYIVSQNGEVSHQCDMIIYHKNFTPRLHTPEGQKFFPMESVIAIGEIKSKVDRRVLDDAIEKLTRIKIMREQIEVDTAIARRRPAVNRKYSPVNDIRDQVATFIMCEEFTCSKTLLSERIKKAWAGSSPRHRVNLITAIRGGTCTYSLDNKSWMYPVEPEGSELPVRFDIPEPGGIGHLALFIRYLLMIIEDNTVLYPELTRHLGKLLIQNTSSDI